MREAIDINVSAEMQSVAAAMEALGNETRLSVSGEFSKPSVLGEIQKRKVVLCVMNFKFIGGSMGSAVGEKISKAINLSPAAVFSSFTANFFLLSKLNS